MQSELRRLISQSEQILYDGKPDKKCFFLECIFNPLLPIAIVWAIIDFGILGMTIIDEGADGFLFFLIPFMTLHLMPVWLYLGGILFATRKYRNTEYVVTDRAIYVSYGTFTKNVHAKPFNEPAHVQLHQGFFDQKLNVGDVIVTTSQRGQGDHPDVITFNSISDYVEVYNLIQQLQTDIYADTMYPNDLRPEENHGYQTKYRK